MLKVIIAGSRDFNDYQLLKQNLGKILQRYTIDQIEIVSGGARGADRLGERYAKERGMILKIIPADWNEHGKSAGFKRNAEMATYATHCIAFWDGRSSGTKHMIDLARQYNLELRVIKTTNYTQVANG
ncbi:DUF2493 domain-containing protein [Microcoleus sp. herbarium7]|uniref:DUF2493 domain-containing protein n=1 Tax=Microcoleus sp. herbarium7 TaxID=3055435 RepID=UPI002FD5B6F5